MRISDWSADVCSSDLQGAFHLCSAHAVAGDVDDVVDASGDPVVAVGVAPAAVAGAVHPGIGREIGLHEAIVVTVDRAHLPRPGQIGSASCRERVCPSVYNSGVAVTLKKKNSHT